MEDGVFAAFHRGERETLERIYREHLEEVRATVKYGLWRARRLTTENVADVVQEVFAKAFRDEIRRRYERERPYAPFLRALARNVLIDWLRRSQREVLFELCSEFSDDGVRNSGDSAVSAERDDVSTVRRYLVNLEPELRVVYELRFVAEEGQHRAAALLGTSRQRLRTLERKLLEGLRRELAGVECPKRRPSARGLTTGPRREAG